MKIGICVAVSAAILVGACASEPHPYKRPLSLDSASAMGETNIHLIENNDGVQSTWFVADNSAAGAQYGLIGALVTATIDGMINAGPADAAQKLADQVAVVATVDRLNQNFRDQVKGAAALEQHKIRFGEITTRQKLTSPQSPDDTVEVHVAYMLSEDASALKVVASAAYARADIAYKTPYTFKSVPEDELSGPLYRNSFTYESNRLPTPVLTPELKAAWVEEVKKIATERYGKLPVAKKDRGYGALNDAISEATNDTLTKEESSRILVKAWTENDGAFLYNELQAAHAYLAKYLLHDMNDPTVPSLEGQDKVIEQLADGRTVRVIGAGHGAGSYISSPGNLATFTTYGNAVQIAKIHRDRASSISEAAKKKK